MNFLEQLSPLCPEAGDLLPVQTGERRVEEEEGEDEDGKMGFP